MPIDLQNRVIVITGASSGIGAATALACARAGMHVVLHGRDNGRLAAVAHDVLQLGRRAETLAGDVTEPGLGERLLDLAEARLGGFYAVFANAGYAFRKPLHEATEAELRRIFDVNFFSATALVTAAARRLIAARRPGHLLQCSSALAKFSLPSHAPYCATKAAQNHVCRSMALELRPYGIHVSSVHPITTRTAFFVRVEQYANPDADPARAMDHVPKWMVQPPEIVARAVIRCLRRPRPEVWTSPLTRVACGLMTVFPRFMDLVAGQAR